MDKPTAIVRIILQNNRKEFLFLKRKNAKNADGLWCLPGGSINFGETAHQACIRETKEETNLDISNIKFLSYYDLLPIAGQTEKHCLGLYFKADFSGNIELNKESSEFKWINLKNINDFKIAFNQDKVIKKFLD